MTIYLHDKRPKRGMLQAAKEQGFEQAMQQVEALEAEIERLRARLSLAERSIQEFKADRADIIEECAKVAQYSSWRGGDSIARAIRALKDKP